MRHLQQAEQKTQAAVAAEVLRLPPQLLMVLLAALALSF
jgi:hypothetical protein